MQTETHLLWHYLSKLSVNCPYLIQIVTNSTVLCLWLDISVPREFLLSTWSPLELSIPPVSWVWYGPEKRYCDRPGKLNCGIHLSQNLWTTDA